MTTINSTYSSSVFNEMNFNKQNTQTVRVNLEPQSDTFVSSKADKKSTIKKIAIGVGIGTVIGGIAVGIITHKKLPNSIKLKDIKFDKGIASTANGEKFTGIVKDKLKNGDKITLEYVDGVIQNSKRSGSRNFEKTFKTNDAGHKIVKTLENGAEKILDITQIKIDINEARERLKDFLHSDYYEFWDGTKEVRIPI